jgi:periplasmic copper chaperone A
MRMRTHMPTLGPLLIALALIVAAATATAQEFAAGPIKVTQVWSREVPPASKVAGGFMTITNSGSEPDTLVGGSIIGAAKFEVHEMAVVDGVMRMRELKPGLVIAPGKTVVLKPGSFHVMFMDLKEPPQVGKPITGTLIFEKAGRINVTYRIEPFGTLVPGDGGKPMPKPGAPKKGGSGHGHN